MPRYMIEAAHDPDPAECLRLLDAFVKAGSHYMTRAEWGCLVDDHRSWITVDVEDDATAHLMVPPVLRSTATVTQLFEFEGAHIDLLKKLSHEQFLQLRRLSPEQMNKVIATPPDQALEVIQRLIESLPTASA